MMTNSIIFLIKNLLFLFTISSGNTFEGDKKNFLLDDLFEIIFSQLKPIEAIVPLP